MKTLPFWNQMGYDDRLLERFWSKVTINYINGDPDFDSCMIWNAATDKDGYGTFTIRGCKIRTHRFIYQCFNGLLNNNLCVLHKCDNPPCVNPYHLFTGTLADNVQDMVLKDRNAKGSAVSSAHLCDMNILSIIDDIRNGNVHSIHDIVIKYHIHVQHIHKLLYGMIWTHITIPYLSKFGLTFEMLRSSVIGHSGSKHERTSLDDIKVKSIKVLLSSGNYTSRSIAKMFNVSESVIYHIKRGDTWQHITI